jgi:hypothetical protein
MCCDFHGHAMECRAAGWRAADADTDADPVACATGPDMQVQLPVQLAMAGTIAIAGGSGTKSHADGQASDPSRPGLALFAILELVISD